MTRFGMQKNDFCILAELIKEVVADNADVRDQVKSLRKSFSELQFCFHGDEYADVLQALHNLL
jgi:hypothetical protein